MRSRENRRRHFWERAPALRDHRGREFKFEGVNPTEWETLDKFGWCWLDEGDEQESKLLLLNGRCGGCGLVLSEVPVEPDGATVCPKCGAAWKLGGLRAEYLHFSADAPMELLLRSGSHFPIVDGHGRSFPFKAKTAEPIERWRRNRGVHFMVAVTVLIALCCVIPPELIFVGVMLLLLAAFGHALTHGLDLREARKGAERMLATDQCPCCEMPLGRTLSSVSELRLCKHCGGAWHPSGAVDRIKAGSPS